MKTSDFFIIALGTLLVEVISAKAHKALWSTFFSFFLTCEHNFIGRLNPGLSISEHLSFSQFLKLLWLNAMIEFPDIRNIRSLYNTKLRISIKSFFPVSR